MSLNLDLDLLVFASTSQLKFVKLQYLSLAPCRQMYRVTDESWVAETAVWLIPFLINVIPTLKGTPFYFLFEGMHLSVISELIK